jgi:hypothetical protein
MRYALYNCVASFQTISHYQTSGFQGLNSEPTFLNPCYKMLILNLNCPPRSHFSFFAKVVSLKVDDPLMIYQNTKFHCPILTGASFTFTSKVWTSAILEWLQLRHYKLWRRGHLQWHDLTTEFHKNLPLGSEVDRGDRYRHTDRMVITLAYFLPLGRKVD